MYWNGKLDSSLGLNTAKKNQKKKKQLYQKMLQIKVVENYILYKKLNGHTCLFPLGVELGPPKITMFQILYCRVQY